MPHILWISGAKGFVASSLVKNFHMQDLMVYEMRILREGIQITEPLSEKSYMFTWSTKEISQIPLPTHILHFGAKGVGEPNNAKF